MKEKSIGFVGGGRVARIILGGLKKAGRIREVVVARDTNAAVLKRLQAEFPGLQSAINNNREAAAQDLGASLADLIGCVKQDARPLYEKLTR